jgi:hypothetical protein
MPGTVLRAHGVLSVLVLAFCGLRWGEAIALRVRDVEFLKRRLAVSENAVQLGVDHAVRQTKGRAVRSVPVPSFVLTGWLRSAGTSLDTGWCSRVATAVSPAAEVERWLVRRGGEARRRPADYSARPAAHLCVVGGVGQRQRPGLVADARGQVGDGHTGHLRGSVRRGPRRRCGHTPCVLFTRKCGQSVATRGPRRRSANMKIALHLLIQVRSYGGGGGI